jgi:DNA end-binding protein Ku
MARPIWSGTISFGLVSIPVSLLTAERPRELAFHLVDDRDLSPIHNLRVNEATGAEVPWEHVTRSFEIEAGRSVLVTDEDLRQANVQATQTIDVLAAVCAEEIHPELFATPYYLVPDVAGRKPYLLLREALRSAGRVALAKIVIRTRQHLAAIIPDGDLLLLEIVRYPHELSAVEELDLPGSDKDAAAGLGVTTAELNLATQLVETISRSFDPAAPEYRDSYHDDLLALLRDRAAGEPAPAPAAETPAPAGQVVDIVELLKRSLDEAQRAKA